MLVQMGSAGNDVVAVQQALVAAGYTNVAIDGIFGPLTQAAVMNFQRADEWPVTGVVDDALFGRMQEIAGMLIVSATQSGLPLGRPIAYNPLPMFGPYLPGPVATNPTYTNGGAIPTTGGTPVHAPIPSVPVTSFTALSTPMMIGVALLGITLYVVANR